MPVYQNNRAKNVKDILRRAHAAVPTAHHAAPKPKIKTETAVKNLLGDDIAAVRHSEEQRKRYNEITTGATDPTADEAIHLLRTVLIPHLPASLLGYDHGELHDIAPVVVHVSQIEGKAAYHFVTKRGLLDFLQKMSNGWGPDIYPLPIDYDSSITPVTPAKYGVCKRDLPQSRAQKNMDKKTLAEMIKKGILDWSPPPFIQSDPDRRAGAEVYLHMSFGSFSMKDKNGVKVAERDIIPDADDRSAFVDMILTMDLRRHTRAIDINTKILVRAAKYIIWAKRQDPANIAPPLDVSAEGLGLKTPSSQYDEITKIAASLRDAVDHIDSNTVTQNYH